MKKHFKFMGILLAIILLAVSLTACGGGGGGTTTTTDRSGNTLTIKGNFTGGSHASLWLKRFLAWIIPAANALDPNHVSKVIVFSGDGRYEISNVTNGSFSIEVEKGSPLGLIFVGANNNYLGYLTLENGIDSIPLTKVREGVTTIDLQTLSSTGRVVKPGHNPLGSTLPLTSEEQTAIALMDDFYSAVVKNPDVDGNGTIDLLENKFFRLSILYFIRGGNFGSNLTPTVNSPAHIDGYKLAFDAKDTNRPATVSFTGPSGSGLSNSTSDQSNEYTERTTYFSPYVSLGPPNSLLPPAGEYTVSYKTSISRFNIPDQSAAPSHIVLAVPTVTLNGDGTINKVKWVYRSPGGTTALDPQAIIEWIELQIDGSGTPCANYPQPARIYNSGNLSATTTEHVLSCQNLSWSNVTRIHMAYNDVYGNHYVVTWYKQ